MKDCPNCGATIADEARFCHYCMTSLDEKTPAGKPRQHWVRAGAMALAGVVFLAAVGWGAVSLAGTGEPGPTEASSAVLTANAASAESSAIPASSAAASAESSAAPASSAATSAESSAVPASSAATSAESSAVPASAAASSDVASSEDGSPFRVGDRIGYTVISETGETGDCAYCLTADGGLTVSGKGAMADYTSWNPGKPPWKPAGLTSLTIEPGVTHIGEWAFYQSKITTVVLPDSVTEIGQLAFCRCTELTSVTFGSGLKSIGLSAFKSCDSLTSVVLPDGCTTIGNYAFAESGLRRIVIPASVTEIGESAFSLRSPTIVTTKGSAADQYAKKNELPVEYL